MNFGKCSYITPQATLRNCLRRGAGDQARGGRRRGAGNRARGGRRRSAQALREKDECAEDREHDPEADLGREHVALRPSRHLRGVGAFRREHEDRDERRDEGEVIDGEKSE